MLTREEFVEKLNFHCKVDGKEVWVNIMPLIKTLFDEHEAQMKDKDEEIEMLKKHVEHLKNVYIGLNQKYLKVKLELEELKDNA